MFLQIYLADSFVLANGPFAAVFLGQSRRNRADCGYVSIRHNLPPGPSILLT